MFLNGDPGEFFDKEFFIKLIGIDDIFQRAKARKTTAYAGGMTVNKKPGGFGCGLQNTFHACFRNFKIIVHHAHRISLSPNIVFALAQIRIVILFFQTVCNAYQIVRLDDLDFLPACFDDLLPLPFAEQAADCVKRGASHLCHILSGER